MGAVTAAGRPVLATSPEELRRAARALRRLGEELEAVGARAFASSALGDRWTGLAALEQQARTGALRELVALSAAPGLEVAQALERCAGVAEDAGARVRSGAARVEQALAELARLRALGPPPEPLLEQAWQRRLQEVEQEVARGRRLIAEAEEMFDVAQQQAAGVLGRAWAVVEEAPRLWEVGNDLRKAVTAIPAKLVQVVRTTDMVLNLARARWATDAAARAAALHRATARLERLWQQLTSPRAGQRLARTRFLPGPVGTVLSWFSAWGDRRDGGGYAGWRGDTTRVLATGAVVGGPLALAGFIPGLTPALPVGVGLITVYQTWMLGNAAWDALPAARRYARLAVRHAPAVRDAALRLAGRARDRAVGRLQDLRAQALGRVAAVGLQAGRRLEDVRAGVEETLAPLRDPGRWVIGVPPGDAVGGRVREVVGELVGRLPETRPVRDRIRQVGVPIRLPGVPLGPVLRAPIHLGRLPWTGAPR